MTEWEGPRVSGTEDDHVVKEKGGVGGWQRAEGEVQGDLQLHRVTASQAATWP